MLNYNCRQHRCLLFEKPLYFSKYDGNRPVEIIICKTQVNCTGRTNVPRCIVSCRAFPCIRVLQGSGRTSIVGYAGAFGILYCFLFRSRIDLKVSNGTFFINQLSGAGKMKKMFVVWGMIETTLIVVASCVFFNLFHYQKQNIHRDLALEKMRWDACVQERADLERYKDKVYERERKEKELERERIEQKRKNQIEALTNKLPPLQSEVSQLSADAEKCEAEITELKKKLEQNNADVFKNIERATV